MTRSLTPPPTIGLRRLVLCLALAVSVSLGALAPAAAGAPQRATPPVGGYEPLDVQAHRGGLGLVVESTRAAFANALEIGVSTLELDVQITQDGYAVVTHDRQVAANKCRDTSPAYPGDPEFPYVGDYIVHLTLAQVRTLDCGSQTLPQHPKQRPVPGARMPLLSEVFDLVKRAGAREVWLNIELKVEAAAPEETAPREQFVRVATREIRQAGMTNRVTIQSFDWGTLMLVDKVAPQLPLVALTNKSFLQVGQPGASPWLGGIDIDDFDGSLVAAAASFGADAISPVHGRIRGGDYQPYVTEEMVAAAHEAGMEVIPWTVDDPKIMRSLIEIGVDGIITNYPNRLRTVLRALGMPLPRSYPAAPFPPAPCSPNATLFGFADRLNKQTFAGTDVGGLSALAPSGTPGTYYALVDNQASTAARYYTVRIPVSDSAAGRPDIGAVTLLRTDSGQPFTGRNFDGEGIVVTRHGDLLVSSETEPAIRRFAPDGTLLGELPVPQKFRIHPAGRGRENGTFESLALSPNERDLFTAVEKPLLDDGKSPGERDKIRILRYTKDESGRFRPAAEYLYAAEPGQGVTEIVALSQRRLLVLERGYQPDTGNTIRIFAVSIPAAVDKSGERTPRARPLEKSLLVDLSQCPPRRATSPGNQRNPLLDNFEGMALGPRLPGGGRALLLISDDNFNDTQVTRVLALSVHPHP